MCCLFGLYDYGGMLSVKQKNRIVSALAVASEVRGTDATGIAYKNGTHLCIYKRPFPARWMRFRIPAEAKAVMGHTRMTTQGSEKQNCNNHPFYGTTNSGAFALAHNGILSNDLLLRTERKLPVTKIETDSFVIVQLLEQAGGINADTLLPARPWVESGRRGGDGAAQAQAPAPPGTAPPRPHGRAPGFPARRGSASRA